MTLQVSMYDTALSVRLKFETDSGWPAYHSALNNKCGQMSDALTAALSAIGLEAVAVRGTYFGFDPCYQPDFSDWDAEAVESHDSANGYSHCWVECCGQVIDICADQFHPEDRARFRVVIESVAAIDYQKDF